MERYAMSSLNEKRNKLALNIFT